MTAGGREFQVAEAAQLKDRLPMLVRQEKDSGAWKPAPAISKKDLKISFDLQETHPIRDLTQKIKPVKNLK